MPASLFRDRPMIYRITTRGSSKRQYAAVCTSRRCRHGLGTAPLLFLCGALVRVSWWVALA